MFNPHHHHQQQQQQFHQHVRQLQQLFQQQRPPPPPPPPPPPQPPPSHHMPHHHQSARPIAVAAPAPPPPRMVNLCSATQATIIAPNPMLQGALLMQQMQAGGMRGFTMGGQQFPQFFPAGSRSSLLGPVPMGVAIKTPHIGFAPRHYNPHARYMNNDYASRQLDRKRENEQRQVGTSEGQPGVSGSRDEAAMPLADGPSEAIAQQEEEPAQKKARTEGAEEAAEDGESPAGDSNPTDCVQLEEGVSTARPDADEVLEQSRAAEVGEQENGEGQMLGADPDETSEAKDLSSTAAGNQEEGRDGAMGGGGGGGEGASNKYYCYICNITCHNQQNFQGHMNGLAHQQRMMEIQHMSNACLVTLLPKVQESLQGSRRDGEKRPGLQRWCAACQTHFTCNVMEHRRTKEHKLCSRTSSPCCTVCRLQFRTSREFVEHMQTTEHQQKVQELRERQAEGLEDLSTLDEKGCFVGEEEIEEKDDDGEDEANGQAAPEVTLEDMADDEEFDPHTIYGSSFLVPAAGFLCRLCNRFYHFESTARHSHCESLQHFENLKKYRALRKQEEQQAGDASGADANANPEDPELENPDEAMTTSDDHQGGDTTTTLPSPPPDPEQDQASQQSPDVPYTSSPAPPHLDTLEASERPTAQEDIEDSQVTHEDSQVTDSQVTQATTSNNSDDDGSSLQSSTQPPEAAEDEGPEDLTIAKPTPEPQNVPEAEEKVKEEKAEEEEVVAVAPTAGRGRGRGAAKRKSGRTTRRR